MNDFKVGDTVRVNEFFLEIMSVEPDRITGEVNLGNGVYGIFQVPLVACEPFDPHKDQVSNDFDERD